MGFFVIKAIPNSAPFFILISPTPGNNYPGESSIDYKGTGFLSRHADETPVPERASEPKPPPVYSEASPISVNGAYSQGSGKPPPDYSEASPITVNGSYSRESGVPPWRRAPGWVPAHPHAWLAGWLALLLQPRASPAAPTETKRPFSGPSTYLGSRPSLLGLPCPERSPIRGVSPAPPSAPGSPPGSFVPGDGGPSVFPGWEADPSRRGCLSIRKAPKSASPPNPKPAPKGAAVTKRAKE